MRMPKCMITANLERASGQPWGFVIVGGKDQALTVKLGRIKPYSPAEKANLKVSKYIRSVTTPYLNG